MGGYDRITGRSVYAGDVRLTGMCHAVVVRSPHAHARILAIDTTEATGSSGVLAVATGADLTRNLFGRRVRDIPLLANELVRFVGERVAAVVAETRSEAERAAARIRVEYDPMDAVADVRFALADLAPRVHDGPWRYVNAAVSANDHPNLQSKKVWQHGHAVEQALAAAAHVFRSTYRVPSRHQGYLEPHVCLAARGLSGVDIWASNKSPYLLREQVAACLDLDQEEIRVHDVAIGGDFGGKGSPMEVPLCVALAEMVGRPVRMEMRYAEDLMAANPSHPAVVGVALGVDHEGRIVALDVDALLDGGAYAGYKPNSEAQLYNVRLAGACYSIPALRIQSKIAYTNTVPKGHIRAPGGLQVNFAVESILDEAARSLAVDPFEFRARNVLRPGERGALGEEWLEVRTDETLRALKPSYDESACERSLRGPDWAAGRGVSLFCQQTHAVSTEVALEPTNSGELAVLVPFPDQGGGQHTVVRNVVVDEVGIPAELVTVRQADQVTLQRDFGVGASRVTVDASEALAAACAGFLAAVGDGGEPPALEDAQGWRAVVVALQKNASITRFVGRADHADAPATVSFCAQLARVQVDLRTGEVRIDEVVSAVDVANVVDEAAHLGQIEGGVVMGIGHALMEDLSIREGRVAAANLGEYKLPSIEDVPRVTVRRIRGGRGVGARNVKPIGELAHVAVVSAIANAVADAVSVRVRDLPIAAEHIFASLVSSQQADT